MKPCGCVCGMCVCCECCKKKRKRVSEPIIIEDEEIMPETTTTRPTSDLEPPLPPKKKKKKKKLGTAGNRIVISDDEDDDISATIHPTDDFEPPAPFLEPEPEPEPVHVTPNLEPPPAVPERTRKRKKTKHVSFNLEPPETVVTADLGPPPPPPPPPPRARKRITPLQVTDDLEPPGPTNRESNEPYDPWKRDEYFENPVDETIRPKDPLYDIDDETWEEMERARIEREKNKNSRFHIANVGEKRIIEKFGEAALNKTRVQNILASWLEKYWGIRYVDPNKADEVNAEDNVEEFIEAEALDELEEKVGKALERRKKK